MENIKFKIFENAGIVHTQNTLNIAKENANCLDIKNIIIASTGGDTIKLAVDLFDPSKYNLICVTHNYYFREGSAQTFPEDLKEELIKKGVSFVQGTLAFSGVESALLRKYQHFDGISLFSKLLRELIGDGVKVGMEIALMSVDAGKVDMGEDVITIAGTGRGADTCCWIKASSSRLLEKLRVKGILAKPQ